MADKTTAYMKKNSPYSAAITREQFLFRELRITAKLVTEGLPREDVVECIVRDNLFQYPTERSVRKMALACLRRLDAMQDDSLVRELASQGIDAAKQICLYAMMKQYRLVWDFMVTVIGEKYRQQNFAFSRADVKMFFMRLQEQDDWVATWSDNTVTKVGQVLMRILVENEYIASLKADRLNPVWLYTFLENAIRANNDEAALPAFNCLSSHA